MARVPTVEFDLRRDGYALLSLDHFRFADDNKQRRGIAPTLVPPRRTPMFNQDVDGPLRSKDLNRTWYLFFEKLANDQGSMGSGLVGLRFLCPSIDEEDILVYGSGMIEDETDPATFVPGVVERSRYGTKFEVGDYIIWEANKEIDQILAIGDGEWKVKRREDGAPQGQAHFGSHLGAPVGRFYRLTPTIFSVMLTDGKLPDVVGFPWANKTVAAVRAWGVSLTGESEPYTLNLGDLTPAPRGDNCPGWRTMNGAAYTNLGIEGELAAGMRAAHRIKVQAWESIRTVYGYLKTPADGDIEVSVVFITPNDSEDDRREFEIDQFKILAGDLCSFKDADRPDGRQMPYNHGYPPSLLDEETFTVFSPDGEIDFIVTACGSEDAPGADLMVTVQT